MRFGEDITVPVGRATLGRIFNLLGEPIDEGDEVKSDDRWPIHRPAPNVEDLTPTREVLEARLKVIDLRGGTYQDVVMYQGSWPMGRASSTNANGTWNHLRVEARGNRYCVFVNGEQRLDKTDGRAESRGDPHSAKRTGRIALPAYTGGVGQCTVYYDNVVVTALK